jgi:selenoprotein W-related protein
VAEELLTTYQHIIEELRVVSGRGGVFEVRVNDDLIFSKKTLQKRHAEPGEILAMFRDIVGPDVPTYPQTK